MLYPVSGSAPAAAVIEEVMKSRDGKIARNAVFRSKISMPLYKPGIFEKIKMPVCFYIFLSSIKLFNHDHN